MRNKEIAIIIMFSALYVVIGYFIPYIAFGQYQCRVQDALYALIPLFGLSGVIGTFLGHTIYNIYGFIYGVALGPLDLLSPLMFLPAKILLWKKGIKMLPLHILSVAIWVGYLLQQFNVPWTLGILSVGIGEIIAEIGLGVPLYYAVKRGIQTKNN